MRVKKRFLLIIVVLLLLSACGQKEKADSIKTLINTQIKAIKTGDLALYISTLDKSKPEYIAEKKSWFRDLQNNNIKNFKIKIININKISDNKKLAKLKQTYRFKDKIYSLMYTVKYIKKGDKWVDSDLNFETIQTKNFVINYPQGNIKYAKLAAEGAERAYKIITDRLGVKPDDRTVIKLYEDKELLRQSVKLSFAWQFAGWYEYPESIKTMIYDSSDVYRNIVAHELVHKITIAESKNNMPYWFGEGLAVYFTEFQNNDINTFRNIKKENFWDIKELEKLNLENMTNQENIRKYYLSSGIIVGFICNEYGKDSLLEIIRELGKFEYAEGTAAEVDGISIKRFHKVIPKVLGINIDELNNKYRKWIGNY
ncbi:hypothetical protein [Thermohalobacter berrensis]|uniref:Peptidase MA-like domain-containing protein n=1 Tax=Thermohalobacter berrensis TaxID=99594 RepID=A0A419T9K5_9FIRM|nr:hypothetical protein [Thermohalobacter berrensis]RKD34149.1 hypothetical protein BET03_07615 [Thermohalobacter berrensis]